jgi:uncharacterized protein
MAAYFLDTSALMKRYVAEVGSAWVAGLTNPAAGHSLWIASVTRVELLAALYRRVRTRTLSLADANQTALVFRRELTTHFQPIPANTPLLDRAMLLVAIHPLRAYDALQLAAALFLHDQRLADGLTARVFICADQVLSQAAVAEGLSTDDPNLHPYLYFPQLSLIPTVRIGE